MPRSALLGALVALTAVAPSAHAFRLPDDLGPVARNPAEHLLGYAIDDVAYDPARRCDPKAKPGVKAMVGWLQRHASGVFWGSYRCERWGKGSASLHAEGRAIDWHLDARRATDRAAARRLIEMLLAPDSEGNEHALARRMGVQEIIWDCSYWGAGMSQFKRYGVCFNRHGERRRRVNATAAHIDHIHFGMTKAGAARRTTYWRQAAVRR